MRAAVPLIAAVLLGLTVSPALAWEEGDRQAYNNKMSVSYTHLRAHET